MLRSATDVLRLGTFMLLLVFWFLWTLGAYAQDRQHHDHGLRGPHPNVAAGEPDPYATTSSVRSPQRPSGINCCHGRDCSRYDGPPPVRVERNGEWGYLFAGKWFFEDWRRIDVTSLALDVRGEPVLCIGANEHPVCYHWPSNG